MDFKNTCLAYLEGELSEIKRDAFEAELQASPEKQQQFSRYRQILEMERSLAKEQGTLGPNFTVRVMDALETERSYARGFLRRYISVITKLFIPFATMAVAVLCLVMVQDKNDTSLRKISNKPSDIQNSKSTIVDKLEEDPGSVAGPLEAPKQEWFAEDEVKKTADKEALTVSYDNQQSKPQAYDSEPKTIGKLSQSLSAEENRASSKPQFDQYAGGGHRDSYRIEAFGFDDSKNKEENKPLAYDSMQGPSRRRLESPAVNEGLTRSNRGDGIGTTRLEADSNVIASAKRSSSDDDRWFNSRGAGKEKTNELAPRSVVGSSASTPLVATSNSAVPQEEREVASLGAVSEYRNTQHPAVEKQLAGQETSAYATNYRNKRVIAGPDQGQVYLPPPRSQQAPSGEHYGDYRESPRIMVSEEPRSTFSIDVDTGSYSNMRRFLAMGQLPPPQSVRIEEYLNYFNYDYPGQIEKPFNVHYELAPSPFAVGRHLLKVGIKARDAVAAETVSSWNLVFLVDVSGSMASANKLPLLKRSMTVLVDQMRPEDRIAIVTYSGGAQTVLESTPGTHKQRIKNAIRDLMAGGSTNGSAGIELAYRVAEQHRLAEGVNRVVLATDGDFNVGTSDFDGLMRIIDQKRRSGVTLTSLGFGQGDLKEKNLEQLANRGNGNYFYIDSLAEASKVLGEQLVSTMQVVAKDVKLQIEFNPKQVIEYRLLGYDNRRLANQDFANDAVDAGEIGSGHTVTAMYELVLADSSLAEDISRGLRYRDKDQAAEAVVPDEFASELAFVMIRFKQPNGTVSSKMQFPIERQSLKADFSLASTDFRFASAVAAFGQLLRQSDYSSGYSFDDISRIAKGSLGEDRQGHRRQFHDLVRNAAASAR